jgi:hypothetical protein
MLQETIFKGSYTQFRVLYEFTKSMKWTHTGEVESNFPPVDVFHFQNHSPDIEKRIVLKGSTLKVGGLIPLPFV